MPEQDIVQEEGQAELAPETIEQSSEVDSTESPVVETDKDLTEWATNKGYSEDDLSDPKVAKAIKMAKNAESFAGKQTAQKQEEPQDDVDVDKWIEDLLGSQDEPEVQKQPYQTLPGFDLSNLSPQDKQALDLIKAEARKEAQAAMAPALAQARKADMAKQFNSLKEEYGDDFTKNAKEILTKLKESPGTSLKDATRSILLDKLLKGSLTKGINKGKQIAKQEVAEQVETVKKTDTKSLQNEFDKLSADEQESILLEMQNKGQL